MLPGTIDETMIEVHVAVMMHEHGVEPTVADQMFKHGSALCVLPRRAACPETSMR